MADDHMLYYRVNVFFTVRQQGMFPLQVHASVHVPTTSDPAAAWFLAGHDDLLSDLASIALQLTFTTALPCMYFLWSYLEAELSR